MAKQDAQAQQNKATADNKKQDTKPTKKKFASMPDDSLFKRIKTDWTQSYSVLAEVREEMRMFDAYYLANQWRGKRPDWMARPVINYVAYIVDQKAPQILQSVPAGIIMANAAEDEEIAQYFDHATQYITRFNHFDEVTAQVVRNGLLLGTGFYKVYWDNTLKGGGNGKKWVGNVVIEEVDPGNIYPDPQAYCVDDCRYIIYAAPRDVQWIRETFGQDVEPETDLFQNQTEFRLTASKSNRVMMYEYWYRENGTINVIYAAGGKILKKQENVYKHGRFPFVSFRPKWYRKSFWGVGEPKNIISNQDILNQMVEMQVMNGKLTANPIMLVGAQSGIDPDKAINKPGMIYQVKDVNAAARWLEPPAISADIPRLQENIVQMIEKIGGVYDAVTGDTPVGITAASAIQMLQEQGSIPLKDITRNLYHSVREVYELIIELVKEFYTETRYFRIMGDNNQVQYVAFNASKWAEIDLDVVVDAGAAAPMSKSYLSQLASDLFHAGVIPASYYLDIVGDGLPDKDHMVEMLREKEAQPPMPQGQPAPNGGSAPMPQQTPMQQAPVPQQQQPDPKAVLDHIMTDPNANPAIKQRVEELSKQGLDAAHIMQVLFKHGQPA